MTHQEIQLMPLFKKFISETQSDKRLKRNGKRIKPETIRNYCFVYANLESFITLKGFKFRLKPWWIHYFYHAFIPKKWFQSFL